MSCFTDQSTCSFLQWIIYYHYDYFILTLIFGALLWLLVEMALFNYKDKPSKVINTINTQTKPKTIKLKDTRSQEEIEAERYLDTGEL